MLDPNITHLARALDYGARMHTAAPGTMQAALRSQILAAEPIISDDVIRAWQRIMAYTPDSMPPPTDDLALLVDTIAMRHGLTSRADAWRKAGINPERGRGLLGRNAQAVDWPLWFTCRSYAIGHL